MLKAEDLVEEAISLPVEERIILVDSLLRSLNPPESEIDQRWAALARQRLGQLRSGQVLAVRGEDVFARIWKRFQG